MIGAAAAGHGVFLQRAPTGCGLAGVKNLDVCAGHLLDELRRQRRHAGEALDEVERCALGGQQRTGWPLQAEQRLIKIPVLTVPHLDAKIDSLVHLLKRGQCQVHAGHHQRLPGGHHRRGEGVLRHECQRGGVPTADVLGQRGPNQRQVIV